MVDDLRAHSYALSEIYETGVLMHCICAIVRLGVPERLARGSMELTDLASAVEVRSEPLWRVLRFLAAHQLVTLDGRRVALSGPGRLLCKDHPLSKWSIFAAVGAADTAHDLAYTLRTGNAAIEKALGASLWGYLAANPEEQEMFDALMERHAREVAMPLIDVLEWPTCGTIADIGGGVGTLLAAVLRKGPDLRGILVEQRQVLGRAHAFLKELCVTDRCEFHQGSLFVPPPRADIYILAFVLHDWSDDEVTQILNSIWQGAAPSSEVRIFERLIDEDSSPRRSKMFDIGMLLLTHGRERTSAEFECLLDRTGWKVEKISSHHDRRDQIGVIQARRVSL